MKRSSKQLIAFHTGLLAFDYHRFPGPPYYGNHWHVDLVVPPTELQLGSAVVGDKIYPAKEALVSATDEVAAQRAADLIHAARLILQGSTLLSHLYPGEHAPVYPASFSSASSLEEDETEFLSRRQVMTSGIPLACMIATHASRRLDYMYALAKLRLSLETFSFPTIELDPMHSDNIPKSPLPEDHVRMAFAIVSAWSSIEELGLEIRASSKNPSKLADGSWNPVVKQELESRLLNSHVNLKEDIHWNLRGPRTRIERKRPPIIIQKAPWARYRVRDGQMAVIDAIHYVSYLRSWVAAHKMDKRMIRVLSVYDVANAQLLARRLLLEKMRFWRYWGEGQTTATSKDTSSSPKASSGKK